MDNISLFNLRFPSYSSTPKCQPNSVLSGVVMIKIARPLELQRLSITVKGREKVALRLMTLPSANSIDDLQTLQKTYFRHEKTIVDLSECKTLAVGMHLYHFTCIFPNVNYPASAREMHYAIEYFCSATLYTHQHKYHTPDLSIIFEPLLEPAEDTATRFAVQRTAVSLMGEAPTLEIKKALFKLRSQFSHFHYLPGDNVVLNLGLDPCLSVTSIRKVEYRVVETTACYYSGDWANQSKASHSGDDSDLESMAAASEHPLWSRDRTLHPAKSVHLTRNYSNIYPISRWLATIEFKLPETIRPLPCAFLRFSYNIELTVTFWSGLRTSRVAMGLIPIAVSPDLRDSEPLKTGDEAISLDGSTMPSTTTTTTRSVISIASSSDSLSTAALDPLAAELREERRRRASPPHIFDLKRGNMMIPAPSIEVISM
ncbi:hypothetical protein H4R33_002830 [Dimargaris cristalligena]|uniref:Arrestin-like N-terminal domain-containing protein n=1 Tax=Dimargaris cristalligena TaxID=215637 RepID=A0A4Q0A034_9FUNG|nr:hypothetical protein H4R33_002830 [Dimargaris cristalligena]RKP39078.1 hypothetical protein BJ085DRAFT_37217 [Dimargaris cristalligena]|eukprot:RKP39078.1 hypothetical protein BJ085DRAFT_37217 [Dimargaris cristalligena]